MYKRYMWFWICGECNLPVKTFSISEYLGYSIGGSNHPYVHKETALEDIKDLFEHLALFVNRLPSTTKKINMLKANIGLFEVNYTQIDVDYDNIKNAPVELWYEE